LHDGEVVQKGPLDELVKRPKDAFVTEFLRAQRVALPGIGGAL
jgi:ABC-type proline/glycine betaine transport system ATPase subunit